MDLKHLSHFQELHQSALEAARKEKAATFHLLGCLHKIDRERAYLKLGYSSLFKYVHEGLAYSEAQSYERVEAMRLAFKVNEVGDALKNGDLSMTAVAKIASHAKREKLARTEIAELSLELAHQSVRKVEAALAGRATVIPPARERIEPVAPGMNRLDLTIDQECADLLRQAKELDANPAIAMAEVLKKALSEYVQRKGYKKYGTGAQKAMTSVDRSKSEEKCQESFIPPKRLETDTPNSRYTARKDRSIAFAKSGHQCELESPITGTRCTERTALEIDHKTPKRFAGTNEAKNLQILCRAHNQAKGAS